MEIRNTCTRLTISHYELVSPLLYRGEVQVSNLFPHVNVGVLIVLMQSWGSLLPTDQSKSFIHTPKDYMRSHGNNHN